MRTPEEIRARMDAMDAELRKNPNKSRTRACYYELAWVMNAPKRRPTVKKTSKILKNAQ